MIAPDSFKGTLSALQAAEAMARAVRAVWPGAAADTVPLADGGEGTVEAISAALGGEQIAVCATDPLGRGITSSYLLCGETAFIEMAAASGLPLVEGRRDPMSATTYGTGQLLKSALGRAAKIVLGVGGSATVDGGMGALSALGARFIDANGRTLVPGGGSLQRLARVDTSGLDRQLAGVELVVAADVSNSLLGAGGAAAVFGPQKGASSEQVRLLECGLTRLTEVTLASTGRDMSVPVHGGAAGGLAAGLWAYGGAQMVAGAELVLDLVGFDGWLGGADLVLTGEGRLDRTSWAGKVVSEVVRRANQAGVAVAALAGSLSDEECHRDGGLSAWGTTVPGPTGIRQATLKAEEWLERAAYRQLLWIQTGLSMGGSITGGC